MAKEELAILDEINGLVLSGEIALERLQSAIAERTKQKPAITNKYELTNFLLTTIDKKYKKSIKIGDTYLLNNYLNTTNKLDTNELISFINKINVDYDDSAADQLLNMLLVENYSSDKLNLKNYFKNLHIADEGASGFESFVKCWVVLEKGVKEFYSEEEIDTKKYVIPDFKILIDKEVLTIQEVNRLQNLRKVRNYLLHGIETPSEQYLKENYQILKEITGKIINHIMTESTKDRLKKELDEI